MVKFVCQNCVSHESLKEHIKSNGTKNTCDYCLRNDVVTIKNLLLFRFIQARLDEILTPLTYYKKLESLYYDAHEELTTYSRSYEFFQWFKDDFEATLFDEIIDYTDSFFSDDEPLISLVDACRYKEDISSSHSLQWDIYLNKLNHEFRYSNTQFVSLIEKITSPLVRRNKFQKKFIKTIPIGKTIYRGRVFTNEEDKINITNEPYKKLGPPPNIIASEQRMTPSGISAFYGALDRQTCLAELRPVAGVKIITGGFSPKFKINLLDLDVLKRASPKESFLETDPFAEKLAEEIDSILFFSHLHSELVKPSTSGDNTTYRLTQLFFEVIRIKFLNHIHGVTFSSVQRGGKGKNIVLFPEYSITDNSCGDVYYSHGYTPENFYSDSLGFPDFRYENYSTEPSLTFEDASLKIHFIKAVNVISEDKHLTKN